MKIREWYLSIDKMPLYERNQLIQNDLLPNSKEANALYCMRWLECFGQGEAGWHNFVDTLFMQDYVKEKTYEVLPFWEQHGWNTKNSEKIGLPDNIDEINMGLQAICTRIDARSTRIINALEKKLIIYSSLFEEKWNNC